MAKVYQGEPLDMTQLSAIEINRIRAQRDQLREALWEVVNDCSQSMSSDVEDLARAALANTEKTP